MNPNSNPQTTDDLRQLTGAPKADEPLVSLTEFPTKTDASERPPWTLPLPKLGIVGILFVPVFLIAASLLMQRGQPQQATQNSDQPNQSPTQSQSEGAIAHLQEENAKLKANAALDGQKAFAQTHSGNRQPAKKMTTPTAKISKPTQPTAIVRSTPPQRVPTAISSAPIPRTPVMIPAQPIKPVAQVQEPKIDPTEQWQKLARIGSYGSIEPDATNRPEPSTMALSARNSRSESVTNRSDTIPTAEIAPTSAVQPDTTLVSTRSVLQSESIRAEPSLQSTLATKTPILETAEARILGTQPERTSLIVGTTSTGVVAAPIVIDNVDRNSPRSTTFAPKRFSVVLSAPLKTSTGQIAFPAGTQLFAQVDELQNTGQVDLSATTAVWSEAGQQKELKLPAGVIQIRGERGRPLMAQESRDRNRAMNRVAVRQFLLGAAKRSAGLLNRSSNQIQTGNGSTIITEQNSNPNVFAGIVEGGATQVLETMTDSSKREIEDLQKRPNTWMIQAGQPVEVFVNQSMFLPTS
jgi:Bacterial conjugation TrbI-like protein